MCVLCVCVQSNRVTEIGTCVSDLRELRELYLSHNGISNTMGLSTLTHLHTLDLSNNAVTHLSDLSSLQNLKELWVCTIYCTSQ